MLKDKKVLIGAIVVALLILGGAFMMLRGNNTEEVVEEDTTQSSTIPTLSKEELGLSMELSPDNQRIKFTIAKASDIKHVDYEITYDADSTEDATVKVPKGITGAEDISGSTYETDFLVLGTCSRNVCKYDEGIENIELLLKVTKKDNKVYQAKDSVAIEE